MPVCGLIVTQMLDKSAQLGKSLRLGVGGNGWASKSRTLDRLPISMNMGPPACWLGLPVIAFHRAIAEKTTATSLVLPGGSVNDWLSVPEKSKSTTDPAGSCSDEADDFTG